MEMLNAAQPPSVIQAPPLIFLQNLFNNLRKIFFDKKMKQVMKIYGIINKYQLFIETN